MTSDLDIVVPVYNERENFEVLYGHLSRLVHTEWRLILVYDLPEDTTLAAARPLAEKDKRICLVQNDGRGVLPAIKTGFRVAEAPKTLLLMVDDPVEVVEKIDAMVECMNETDAAVVAASRYMRGGSHHGGNFLKGFLSRMAGLSLHFLVGLPAHDATYATKLFRTSFLQVTPIESTRGFTCVLELTLKAHLKGEHISEVPVMWTERTEGTSRFAFFGWIGAYLYWYIWGIFHYWFSGVKKISKK
ncbi:MAG: glycosyltransferase [Patescibacteria group bacterium]